MSSFVREFKAFINRGNVVDVAVAFIMGAAFKTVVDAVSGDGKDNPGILGGLIGAVFGGREANFSAVGVTLNGSFIPVGSFIGAALNFLLVAFVLFLVLKAYARFKTGQPIPPVETTNQILAEIRDELRGQNGR